MAPRAKSKKVATKEDRISSLPDELLHHILSYLETEYAALTSILSKRWRTVWTSNPNLKLDMPREMGDEAITLIHRFLRRHQNPLNNLSIDITADLPLAYHLKIWLRLAITRNVRELDLRLESADSPSALLPKSFFHHTLLTKIGLIYCSIKLPEDFHGFPFLTYMRLCHVGVSGKAVSAFLSKCPLLETIVLENCEGVKILNISGPNLGLKVLDVRSCYSLKKLVVDAPNLISFTYKASLSFGNDEEGPNTSICFTNVSSLKEAKLDFTERYKESKPEKIHDIASVVISLAHVGSMLASNWICQFVFSEYFVLKNPRIKFMNLKEFRWSGRFKSQYEVLALITFLGDCPLLEKLCINCATEFHYYLPHDECWYNKYKWAVSEDNMIHRQQPDYLLPQLKTIKLIGLKGTQKEMILLRFLLCKATALDSLILASSEVHFDDANDIWDLQQKISCLPKASRHVKISRSKVSWAEFNEKYSFGF